MLNNIFLKYFKKILQPRYLKQCKNGHRVEDCKSDKKYLFISYNACELYGLVMYLFGSILLNRIDRY